MIRPAPIRRALIRWHIPSGPMPYTTTVSAKVSFNRRARSKPWVTAIGSVSTATWSGSSSGTRKSWVPGSRYMYSLQPPNRPGARLQFRLLP